ncbi:MAG: alpha/beta hydrolase, partial [Brachybacterium tyrofermentans]
MNPLLKAVLRLFAAPRVNMREDYAKVRHLQRQLASLPRPRYRQASWRTIAGGSDSSIPVRVF